MPELLKNTYSPELLNELALDIKSAYPPFEADKFIGSIFADSWGGLELKDRVNHIAATLGEYLPQDYAQALAILDKVVMNYGTWLDGTGWYFPVFVMMFGQDEANWDLSIAALERYTPYASAELAVRPFIIKNEKRMMEQMYAWSKHEDEHVRRLSCEGCRPALPWAPALNSFKADPSPILPILERLKNDPSSWVRRSVANNINDMSKTHPDLVVELAKKWIGDNEFTDAIVKHGLRTLLKKGNSDALALFGYNGIGSVQVTSFALNADSIAIGEELSFDFELSSDAATKVRLEYRVGYMKAKGKTSTKIFKISETSLKENEARHYTRKHKFMDVSTRKHYAGKHSITLIVNGQEQGTLDFELTD